MLFIAFQSDVWDFLLLFFFYFCGNTSWFFSGDKMEEQWWLDLFYANVGNASLTHVIKTFFTFIIQWPSNMGKTNTILPFSVELIHFLTV